jgi:hypothetical protein
VLINVFVENAASAPAGVAFFFGTTTGGVVLRSCPKTALRNVSTLGLAATVAAQF